MTMANKFVGQEYMAATSGKGLHQQSKGHRLFARATITCSTFITIISVFIVAFCLVFQMCPVLINPCTQAVFSLWVVHSPQGQSSENLVNFTQRSLFAL